MSRMDPIEYMMRTLKRSHKGLRMSYNYRSKEIGCLSIAHLSLQPLYQCSHLGEGSQGHYPNLKYLWNLSAYNGPH